MRRMNIIESLIATGMYGTDTASEVIKSLVFEHLRGEDNLLSAIFQKATSPKRARSLRVLSAELNNDPERTQVNS